MSTYPKHLEHLIGYFKKLPGIGRRSAERIAFNLLGWSAHELKTLGYLLAELQDKIQTCSECFCLTEKFGCQFCHSAHRDKSQLCIVASAKDVYAIEETKSFQGLYHVLGGLISPLEGNMPEHLSISLLRSRLQSTSFKEVIMALDSTLEGDATALYLKEECEKLGIATSRLAMGLPMGSALDFIDHGTLSRALLGRSSF